MKERGHDQWDENLQTAAAAMRSSVNRHNGFTPNIMMLGREINLPLNLMLGKGGTSLDPSTYVNQLEEKL